MAKPPMRGVGFRCNERAFGQSKIFAETPLRSSQASENSEIAKATIGRAACTQGEDQSTYAAPHKCSAGIPADKETQSTNMDADATKAVVNPEPRISFAFMLVHSWIHDFLIRQIVNFLHLHGHDAFLVVES